MNTFLQSNLREQIGKLPKFLKFVKINKLFIITRVFIIIHSCRYLGLSSGVGNMCCSSAELSAAAGPDRPFSSQGWKPMLARRLNYLTI